MKVESLPKVEEPQFARVPSDELHKIWEPVAEIMTRHPRGLLNIMSHIEVYHGIADGLYDLWVGVRAQEIEMALLTSMSRHTHQNILYIVWGGGKGKEYWELGAKRLEHFAQLLGASQIRCHGREGLVRWGRKFGFHPEEVVLVKHLSPMGNEWRH